MRNPNEPELNEENGMDIFTCQDCKKTTTRKEIRTIWNSIPFGDEENKKYYCGCNGWN